MNQRRRRSTFGPLLALVALMAAACGQGTPSASPSAVVISTPGTTASADVTTAPTPKTTAPPTQSPTAEPTAAPTACPISPETGPLASDRLVNVVASTTADADILTFDFGNMSVPGPGGPPTGELSEATPPYTFGPSGLPITMVGDHVVQVVFRGMSLQADTGDLVYQGPPDLSPDLASLRHAVEYDESEGVIGWYVGYDGSGCVTLARVGDDVTLSFPH